MKKETPNLKNIFNQPKESIEEESQKKEETISTEPQDNQPVTPNQIRSTLNDYLSNHKVTSAVKVILTKEFDWVDDKTIVLPISNKVEINMVEKVEQDILSYLRKSLSNYSLEFQYNVLEHSESYKPYTNAEVFEAMVQKNPALQKLRDVLGLDTDF